jgi:hypothetical protein
MPQIVLVLLFSMSVLLTGNYIYLFFVPHSIVEVEYVAEEYSKPLTYVSIILGGDKSGIADIEPNQRKSTKVYPKENSQMILAVRVLNGSGDGPSDSVYFEENYQPGDQIRVLINVNQEGKVTSRETCKLPCSFE